MLLDPIYRADPKAPALILVRDYRQPLEKLWAAFTIPERLVAWMGVEWKGDPEVTLGSRYSYVFVQAGILAEGRVTAFEPMTLLEHTWFENMPGGRTTVRWKFAPHEGGTRLTLTHTQGMPDDMSTNGAGWADILEELAKSFGEPFDPDVMDFALMRRRLRGILPPAALRGASVSRRANGGYTLSYDRRLAHPVEKVWAALTTEAGVSAWMVADATVEPKVGGRYRLAFRGMDQVMDGVVTAYDPMTRFAYTWPESMAGRDSLVAIDLAPEGEDGCRLVLTHDFTSPKDIIDYAAGWHWHLDQVEVAMGGEVPVREALRVAMLGKMYQMTLFADQPGGAPQAGAATS